MLKKGFFLSLLGASSLFSHIFFPEIIDIDKFAVPLSKYAASIDPRAWTLGRYAFYQSSELIPFFGLLREEYHIEAAVETGTWKGDTTSLFALLFNQVHTIEILDSHYELSVKNLAQFPNVHCHFGSSPETLSKILPSLSSIPTLFYLDAHWNPYWPLLDELEEISKTHKDNCVIVINDIKVPNRPQTPYDTYEDHDCSYEYVKEKLDKIFTEYTIHYLVPRYMGARAKLVVVPKHQKTH